MLQSRIFSTTWAACGQAAFHSPGTLKPQYLMQKRCTAWPYAELAAEKYGPSWQR